MALTSKQPSMRASTLGSRLPDLPHPPATLIEQPGFVEYDREQRRWWNNVRTAIGDTGVDRDKQYSKLAKSVTVGDATLSAAIATETTLRVTADDALASQITTLTANYQAADAALSASITTEATTRASADSAEASTRSSADATLQTNINTVSASVTTETNARVSADSALASSITTVTANYQAADTTLQTNIGKKITVAGSAPGSPATNDLWVDTSDNNKAKYWDGAAWQYKQDLVLSASVTTEASARASADSALATSVTTVQSNLDKKIKVSATAPSSPVLNDLWLDTSDNNKYKFWDGAAWQYKQDLVLAAAVTSEASTRATADGFLEGKYTLTVSAGDVVTGMNITSSSGSGTNISDVTFVAANFKIYNGTTGKVMFNVSGSDVLLANTLTVSTSGKVYIGTGTYNNTNTAFFVDSTGQFSLKDKLAWNGTTLAVSGTITSTAGTIGGWTINSTTITGTSTTLDSAGVLTLGTTNDVFIASAADSTYRLWVGHATAGSASFRVTKAGVVTASGATISGTLTSTAGTIGGFTLSSTSITAGSGAYAIELASDVSGKGFGLKLGTTGAGHYHCETDRYGISGFYYPTLADKGGFQLLSLDTTSSTQDGVLKLWNSSGNAVIKLRAYDGTIDASASYKVNGTKVVGAQGSAIADLALAGVSYGGEAASIEGKINDILDAMRTHGLIAS